MRRVLAFILTICMVLSIAPVAFAADEVPVATANVADRDEAEIVKKLGIMPEAILDKTPVTRAEFISYIINILINTQNTLPAGQQLFNDVDASHQHAGAIYHAMKLGLINGSGDGNFNPDSPILWDQAIKILVGALGFGPQAEDMGGYPAGYLMVAQNKKLTKGIDFVGSNPVLNMDCEILLYRALVTPYVKLTAAGDPDNHYSISANGTWLSDYMHVKRVEGVVKETGKSSLLRKSNIKSNQIKIDSELFNDVNLLGQDLLGYYVIGFAEDNEENNMIYIMPAPNKNNALTIDANDLIINDPEFTMNNGKGCIVYQNDAGRRKELKFENADIIYNGVAHSGAVANDLKINSGSITVLDNNSDSTIVMIEEFVTYIVHSVAMEEKAIYGERKPGEPIKKVSLEPADKDVIFKLVDVDQNELTIDKITPGMVLSVYQSKDGSFVRIVCSDTYVTGTVSAIKTAQQTVDIDWEPYSICYEFRTQLFSEIQLGQTYKFYINDRKEIAALEIAQNENAGAAYLVRSQLRQAAWGPSLLVKFFTTDSEFITAEVAERFIIDGERKVLSQCVRPGQPPVGLDAILNGADKVFEYVLDDEGKLIELDFPYATLGDLGPNESPESIRTYGGSETMTLQFYGGTGYGSSNALLASGAILFSIPVDKADEENYTISSPNSIPRDTNYTVKAYTKGTDNIMAKYVIGNATASDGSTSKPSVLGNSKMVLNDKGDAVLAFEAYEAATPTTYTTKNKNVLDGFEVGDIIGIATDDTGSVTSVFSWYDRSEDSIGTVVNNGTLYQDLSGYGAITGDVYKKAGNYVFLSNVGQRPEDVTGVTEINANRTFDASKCPIFVYDSTEPVGEQLRPGTVEDITDYYYTGNPSHVVVIDQYMSLKMILVIK